jgi:molybdopterin-containing oxidoreductase family iron-sulfur binding subunit
MSPSYPGIDVPDPKLQKATRLGMVVDQDRCIGCWSCAVACKEQQNVGIGLYWLRVLTVGGPFMDTPAGTFPDLTMSYQSTNCFHCDNPPCVKACPTQATYKMANGIVNVNYERCIGCRYCMVACPYDNRVFNWRKPVQEPPADVAVVGETPARPKGVVEKCTFCVQRVTDGLLPRCVVTCPTGARTFGDLDDPNSEVSVLLRNRPSYVVFPERGTRPSLHYLIRTGPNAVGGAL